MTRLAFCEALTREMLDAFFDGYPVRPRAAQAVAEARIRELLVQFNEIMWKQGVSLGPRSEIMAQFSELAGVEVKAVP